MWVKCVFDNLAIPKKKRSEATHIKETHPQKKHRHTHTYTQRSQHKHLDARADGNIDLTRVFFSLSSSSHLYPPPPPPPIPPLFFLSLFYINTPLTASLQFLFSFFFVFLSSLLRVFFSLFFSFRPNFSCFPKKRNAFLLPVSLSLP